jgi:cytochrome c oxidase assembly factor CtaG
MHAVTRESRFARSMAAAGFVAAAWSASLPAFAHGGHAHEAGAPAWTFDAWVTGPLVLSLLWFGAFGNGIGPAWRWLTAPLVATLLQAVALWLWHAPALFDLALAHDGWHVVQHLCFLATALLFWWAVLHGHGERRVGVAIGCLFFTAIVSGALGALMAFSASPWYAGYAASGLDAFGLTPSEDQQLAGVLMWVPGGLVHAGAGLALLARWLRNDAGGGERAAG